jgi:DNA-binding NarL/FixJ family response regulator
MSTTSIARAAVRPASFKAAVVGTDTLGRQRLAALLGSAGFAVDTADRGVARGASVAVVMTGGSDAARVRQVRDAVEGDPDRPVLAIVASALSNPSLRRVLVAGASGIVFETDIERALVPSVSGMLAGQLVVPARLARQIAPRPLSYREKQVLSLVVLGLTNREIASKLFLAESTVKTHLSSSFRKLDARSRADAVERILDPEQGFGTGILELAKTTAA